MGSTKVELVEELQAKLKDIDPKKREVLRILISNAQKGLYHDFESPLAAPKMQLHMDLLQLDLKDIDAHMQRGTYDESPTPAQSKELLDELAKEIADEAQRETEKAKNV